MKKNREFLIWLAVLGVTMLAALAAPHVFAQSSGKYFQYAELTPNPTPTPAQYTRIYGSKNSANNYGFFLEVTGNCSGNANGGTLTLNSNNELVCSDDDSGAASSGDSVTINGSAAVDVDLDDAAPAAPTPGRNVEWQKDASSPANVSAFMRVFGSGLAGLVPQPAATPSTTKFLREDATWQIPAGAGSLAVATKTSNYTLTDSDDVILCDTTSGSVTITTHASSTATKKRYTIKKIAAANTCTIDGNSSETIDGYATFPIINNLNPIVVVPDGTNWQVVSPSPASFVFSVRSNANISNSATNFLQLDGIGAPSATEDPVGIMIPAYRPSRMRCSTTGGGTPGAGKSYALTLRNNGADSDCTCTISDASTFCEDTSCSALGLDSTNSWKTAPSGTPTAVSIRCFLTGSIQ